MTKQDIEYIKFLCSMEQTQLAEYLNDWLVDSGTYSDDEVIYLQDGFLYAQGDIPVCLVAHLDTVHKKLPTRIFHDEEQKILWAKEGIGGDDRCGVFAILKILEGGQRPHVIFTFDEEIGAVGASVAADMLTPKVNFLVEIDRRGEKDCVFYNCGNKDFMEFIQKFGFEFAWGSFSDISYLAPAWKCAAVNISAGYEDEHTNYETINYGWLSKNIERLTEILNDSDKHYEFMGSARASWSYGYDYNYGYTFDDEYYNYSTAKSGRFSTKDAKDVAGLDGYQECDACGEWVKDTEFDQYNCLCKKCCQTFGLKTQEERSKSSSYSSGTMVLCNKCGKMVSIDAYDEDSERCLYCVVDEESGAPTGHQWIDEDNDPYERYSG